MKCRFLIAAALAASVAVPATATELEVTHWWTSGGEAAAVAEFAKAFNAGGDTWIDGAIAGSGGVARPIIVSRIIGGEPMGATQLNHGRQAEELIEAGLMTDLTDLAVKEGWADFVNPTSLLDACTVDGRIYCAPVNIHSWQWIWLSHAAYEKAGVPVPTNWDEFTASAPALRAVGVVPLAMGQQSWQTSGAFGVLTVALAGPEVWLKVVKDKDVDTVMGPAYTAVFEAFGAARQLSDGADIQDWNQATNMVITGQAGGQIMGDWAQGEFQVANQVAGEDYTCLPGLGVNKIISTGGDAFYFPLVDDADIKAAQLRMASQLMSKEVQVAFNLKKGSLPIRGDVDLSSANDCMKQGLEILASGNILPDGNQHLSPDTNTQLEDLMVEFWNDKSITPAEVQKGYASIIADAD
ncbi:MAG: carbohydrate ABC transporter substrate-binding protein [Rhizobiales bacterium]|nr:ABC transporter substrate-binding protein [Hyphomicrobiales bacterium]NRB14477.1 carbohydrate ABC transporter substrate-binding protein [Hyphomicrobiales bacterium]